MLAADKLQLQSALKQQATALKEKEFNLHHSNLMTVGTQAAVLAGLDITMFIEFNPPPWDDVDLPLLPRTLRFFYYITIVAAFCANMIVVSQTTALSVLGAGLALRGPDGSMMTATDGLYEERLSVFRIFGYGLGCTVGSVILCVWLLLNWEAALVCMSIALWTCKTIWINYRRVQRRFQFDEADTVDFRDIMEGPAAIPAVWKTKLGMTATATTNTALPLYDASAASASLATTNNHITNESRFGFRRAASVPEHSQQQQDDNDEEEDQPLVPVASSSSTTNTQPTSRLAVQRRRGGR